MGHRAPRTTRIYTDVRGAKARTSLAGLLIDGRGEAEATTRRVNRPGFLGGILNGGSLSVEARIYSDF
jgi:hypothetical protein